MSSSAKESLGCLRSLSLRREQRIAGGIQRQPLRRQRQPDGSHRRHPGQQQPYLHQRHRRTRPVCEPGRHFDWRGVAAAGVGAGAGYGVNEALGLTENGVSQNLVGAEKLGKSALSGFAAGLTTAALRGGRINATQVATDAFGNALGYSIAEGFGQTTGRAGGSRRDRGIAER